MMIRQVLISKKSLQMIYKIPLPIHHYEYYLQTCQQRARLFPTSRHNHYPDYHRQMPEIYDGTIRGYASNQNFEQITFCRFELNLYRYSFYPRTIIDCNLLPETTVIVGSVMAFKVKLKQTTCISVYTL